MYSVAWLPKDRIDALCNIQSRMLNQLSAMESDYVIDNKRKELCEKAHRPEDEKIRGCTHHQSCCFFLIGTGTVHELVCQPLDETEGAQPRIRLTGIIYRVEWASRTQAWNVSERKCIIDQSLLGDVVLFFAKR